MKRSIFGKSLFLTCCVSVPCWRTLTSEPTPTPTFSSTVMSSSLTSMYISFSDVQQKKSEGVKQVQ